MNKTFKEFTRMDAQELEEFFQQAAYYFKKNAETMPNLPAMAIASRLSDCYAYMTVREGN